VPTKSHKEKFGARGPSVRPAMMDMLHAAQRWAGGQTALEWYLFGGSAITFQILYALVGFIKKQGARDKACCISHVHCFFTVPSACLYWLTQDVDIWSSAWMIEGPGGGVLSVVLVPLVRVLLACAGIPVALTWSVSVKRVCP